MNRASSLLVVLAFASAAVADHTFPSFNATVSGSGVVTTPLPAGGVPPGTYAGYEVLVDWSAVTAPPNEPWSSEARWGLFGGSFLNRIYAAPGAASNSAGNNIPVNNLSWTGSLLRTYNGGDALDFLAAQTFAPSTAQWNNIRVKLISGVVTPPPAPTATNLGALAPGTLSVNTSLAAGEVKWYRFSVGQNMQSSSNTFLSIDTLGSLLAPENDTEIGLYDPSGTLIATNDDINFPANAMSYLGFGSAVGPLAAVGDLAADDFYLAVGGFNTTYANGFAVTSTSTNAGPLTLNLITNVPEPTTLALLAIGGLAAIRRRR